MMNRYVHTPSDVMQRKQRLETLQNARRWQPSDSIEAAKLDSQITTVQGVIRLLEWHDGDCFR